MICCFKFFTKVGDSIKEVYCDVAVKLSGNIMVHALLGNDFICGKVFLWFKASTFQVNKKMINSTFWTALIFNRHNRFLWDLRHPFQLSTYFFLCSVLKLHVKFLPF